MLTQFFPRLKGNAFIKEVERFFHSPMYCTLVAALMAVSEVLAFELRVYYVYLALMLIGFLFCRDTIAAVPVAFCSYMTLSAGNNPIKHPDTTAFGDTAFKIQFIVILVTACVLLILKLSMMIAEDRHRFPVPRLFGGFIVLGLAYMLGGLGVSGTFFKSALFGFVEFVSLALLYVYFAVTVEWEHVRKSYLAGLFLVIGLGLCAEIAGMYTTNGVFKGLTVNREFLYTGWGVYNNVACIMTMCMPAPCYFAATRRHGWPFTVLTIFFYLAVCLTQSRGGILFGTVTALVCALYVLLTCRREARRGHLAVAILGLLSLVFLLYFEHDKLLALFRSLVEAGANPSYRDTIYVNCWKAFLRAPWFGVGFYDTPGFTFDKYAYFMPPRAHNTYMQLLASCGLLGIAAYGLHRFDTIVLYFTRPTHEKTFIALAIMAMLLTSIVDCNFFNFGPGIIYGVLLAFAEGHSKKKFRHKMLNQYTVVPKCLRGQHIELSY